ncbi:methyl-accepting chemotaxis protein [Stenotrophomonas sp. SY1]|uniref:methyl-accepting chemotaxis protein n=1 Tax=Stenotrophomonas sp. SY1 TaxID=477235 RepID=UPI001E512256|nr:methyl-accepting chemotaxis protein [Stenotrophomonas sp. SY1]MCD9085305.1 methyl-accepting chemotaxis protein [Stenotrophomonas sp. SY1]
MKFPLGIAQKLRLSLLALVVGLAVIGSAYAWLSAGMQRADQRLQNYQQDAARLEALAAAFAEVRRAQAEYAMSFSAPAGTAFLAASERLQAALASSAGSAPWSKELATPLRGYLESGKALDERINELGHDADSGLQGDLRGAVHQVENLIGNYDVPALQVSMLTMRRYEKDFILRREQKYADELSAQVMPFELLLQQARMPEDIKAQVRDAMQLYQGAFLSYAAARFGADSETQAMDDLAAQAGPVVQKLQQEQRTALQRQRAEQASARTWMNVAFAVTVLLVGLLLVTLLLLLLRAVSRPLADAADFARAIADGHLDGSLVVRNTHDEIGRLATALMQMQASLRERIASERIAAQANQRVRQALDVAGAAVLVTDAEGRVVYANEALAYSFAQAGIGQAMDTGTDVAVLGEDVLAVLRKAQQAASAVDAEVELGNSGFLLRTSPVLEHSRVLGLVMEWQDRRLERVIVNEVAAVVAAAAAGDLQGRIALDDKQGFVRQLGERINALLDSVQAQLGDATRVIGHFARGDLSARMRDDGRGIYATLRQGLEVAMQQVGGIVSSIQQSAGSVQEAVDDMASGTVDLSGRVEEQVRDVNDALQRVRSVAGEARENAGSARQSAAVSEAASLAAERGSEATAAAISGMEQLRASSRHIREIVATVNSLSFQTNLLALNAAVEAARAGSHGRGFAVVAGEVRMLAQRSAEASQQIRVLVDESLQQVEAGARLVDTSGEAMHDISGRVQQVVTAMARIDAASERQVVAVDDVERLLRRIGEGTQQSGKVARASSQAAVEMRAQAQELAAAAERFVVAAELEGEQVQAAEELRRSA